MYFMVRCLTDYYRSWSWGFKTPNIIDWTLVFWIEFMGFSCKICCTIFFWIELTKNWASDWGELL